MAQPIREIHLTFCTGLSRELTLSPSDRLTAKTIRGPQPETVKDYNLVADGRVVLEVRGNYLRKRTHRLPALAASRLRLEFLATHGSPRVRLFEVRVYGNGDRSPLAAHRPALLSATRKEAVVMGSKVSEA